VANRLAESRSPYLRQHAHQPVDWMPWGDAAFIEAQDRGVPVFLSVGYSACHWCHVMAHESFDDPTVAAFMNEHFVNIKLDREEFPDVDEAYMTAVQLSSGRGGWPMSLFLTHNRRPFFAGTYFPLHSRLGMIGFAELLERIAHVWQTDRDELLRAAEEFTVAVQEARSRTVPASPDLDDDAVLDAAVESLIADFDSEHGGFGGAPKFPPHTALRFLLAYAAQSRTHADEARRMALATLTALVRGGIHDHVGGGFHRYSTDARWFLPHFEKMAYDNAQILVNLVQGGRQAESAMSLEFQRAAERLIGWANRELTSETGLVYSAVDADSLTPIDETDEEHGEGHGARHAEEGRYLTWTPSELDAILGGQSTAFQTGWEIKPGGNFEDERSRQATGRSIPVPSPGVMVAEWDGALTSLLTERLRRPQPGLDDKAIAANNGLMIEALITAGKLDQARRMLDAWGAVIDAHGGLPHQVTHGVAEIPPYLDDVAAMSLAYAALAKATGDSGARARAETLADQIERDFRHADAFSLTSAAHGELFGRTVPALDGPTPSANALAVRALLAVGQVDAARHAIAGLRGWLVAAPTATEGLLLALLDPALATGGPVATPVRAEWQPGSEPGRGAVVLTIAPGWNTEPAGVNVEVNGASSTVTYSNEHGDGDVRTQRFEVAWDASANVRVRVVARWQACDAHRCLAPQTQSWDVESN